MGNDIPRYEDTLPHYEDENVPKYEDTKPIKNVKSSEEPYENFGSDIVQTGADILHGIGTALDYTQAPFRSLLAGQSPLTPLIEGPSVAPTSEQVLEQIPFLKNTAISTPKMVGLKELTRGPVSNPEDLNLQMEEEPLSKTFAPALDIALGAGTASLAKGVKTLGKATGKAVIPKVIRSAYTKGLEDVSIDKNFVEKINRENIQAGEKIAEPIIQKQAAQKATHDQNINNLENQINTEKNNLQKAIDAGDDSAMKSHQSKVEKLEKDIFGLKSQYKDQLEADQIVNKKQIANLKNQIEIENKNLNNAVKNNKIEAQKFHQDKIEKLQSEVLQTEADAEYILSGQKTALAEEHSKNIDFVSNQLENAENEFLKKNTLEEESLISENVQKSKQIEKQKLGLADRIQNRLSEVENVLKKEYDKIDNQLTEQNFQLDTKPIVENFKKQLIDSGITDSKTIESLTKDLDLYAQNSSSKGFMNLKQTLNKMFDNSNPSIKGAAKTGYKQLRELQFSELSKTDKNLAETIANTNKRWAAKYDLEDRLTKISESDSILGKTLKAIESEEGSTAEHLAKQRVLRETLPVFDPEQSSNIIQEMEEMAKQTLASKNFKPEINKQLPPEILELRSNLEAAKEAAKKAKIPEYTNYELYKKQQDLKALKAAEPEQLNIPVNEKIPQLESELQRALEYKQPEYTNLDLYTKERELEALKGSKPLRTISPTNPEIERLQSLIDQSKSKGAGNIAGLERFNLSSSQAIQDDITNLIQQISKNGSDVNVQRKFDDLLKYIKENQGLEAAQSAEKYIIKTAEDKALASASKQGETLKGVPTIKEFIEKHSITGANIAGKTVSKFSRPSPQMVERATTPAKEFLKDGAVQLSEASPEQMQNLANKMSDIGAKGYSDVLSKVATTKNSVSRNAMIFGLMQQPEFRKNFNSVTGKEENEESGK